MREINTNLIKEKIEELFIKCNWNIHSDIKTAIHNSYENEGNSLAKSILSDLQKNMDLGVQLKRPVCQDTGMAIVYLEIGQEVILTGPSINTAINDGVRNAYTKGYLRKSVVADPLFRENTKDNTPAIINYNIVDGDKIKISLMAKGFGSENMSRIKMLKPSDGEKGVKDFILETVKLSGGNPCPPIIVGVGIGGTFDHAAHISKKALLRPIDVSNENEYYKEMEDRLLEEINDLDIGPQGLGGRTTALKVQIETFPTHIAGLPVAVNICCHASRHEEIYI